MVLIVERESREFFYAGVNGQIPSDGAEVAILTPGERPAESDWVEAQLVDAPTHPLWADAVASGARGDYFVAVLVGPENAVATDFSLAPGQYSFWIRLTDVTERPIRVAPEAVRVQ